MTEPGLATLLRWRELGGRDEVEALIDLARVVHSPDKWLGGQIEPSPIDVQNALVVRAREQSRTVLHLMDGGFREAATAINRDLLDTFVVLLWLQGDWEERFRRWVFDDVCRQIEWFDELDDSGLSPEEEAEVADKVRALREEAARLKEKGRKRMPQTAQMFEAVGLSDVYRRQYQVASHTATHPSYFSLNPEAPDPVWSMIVAEPYRTTALVLWGVLDAVEVERARGWRRRLTAIDQALRPHAEPT